MNRGFLVLILLLTVSFPLSSQELNIGEFELLPLDVSARENKVLDVNNEPCGLLKIRTGISDIEFLSNLGIERVEAKTGEYWVWISPGATQIRIGVEGFPLLEYHFPESIKEQNVYSILLIPIFAEQVVFTRDTSMMQRSVSFNTTPPGADVYIDSVFYGKTPLRTSTPDSIFEFSITRNRYKSIDGSGRLEGMLTSLDFDLEKDPFFKRYFILPTIGTNETTTPIYGLQGGRIGRTGFYASVCHSFKVTAPDLIYEFDRNWITPQTDIMNYFYTKESTNNDRENMFRLTLGLTQQVSKKLFLKFGLGYSSKDHYAYLKKYQYEPESNYLPEQVNFEDAYGLVMDESYKGIHAEVGFMIRIKDHFLLTYSNTMNIRPVEFKYMMTDFHIGTGYCF